MRIVRDPSQLDLDRTKTVGFVPTMGALHEGHLELMRQSKKECDQTVVSIFVNPKQFGPKEDYQKYPRDEERDLSLCERVGVDVVFIPSVENIYTTDDIKISVGRAAALWEGEKRPGHFDGVATVVTILFNIVRPNIALFGLKDFQQCAVIASLVRGLHFDLRLMFVETVRDSDGLALSSRNAYLSPIERSKAPIMYRTLMDTKLKLEQGISSILEADRLIDQAKSEMESAGFWVEYLALVDDVFLEPMSSLTGSFRLIVAAKLGGTRLIDNIAVVL